MATTLYNGQSPSEGLLLSLAQAATVTSERHGLTTMPLLPVPSERAQHSPAGCPSTMDPSSILSSSSILRCLGTAPSQQGHPTAQPSSPRSPLSPRPKLPGTQQALWKNGWTPLSFPCFLCLTMASPETLHCTSCPRSTVRPTMTGPRECGEMGLGGRGWHGTSLKGLTDTLFLKKKLN